MVKVVLFASVSKKQLAYNDNSMSYSRRIIMTTEFIRRLKHLICQYQTRKQLRNLPDHLLKDIAVTRIQLKAETKKSTFFIALYQLIKGD